MILDTLLSGGAASTVRSRVPEAVRARFRVDRHDDKLAAVLGVHLPLAFHKEHRANTDVEEISDDRDQFMISLDRSLEHRIAGFS